jgi:hypothetical protein
MSDFLVRYLLFMESAFVLHMFALSLIGILNFIMICAVTLSCILQWEFPSC